MTELELTARAIVFAIAVIGFAGLCFFAGASFMSYARGRKRGGYPILAKTRRIVFSYDFIDTAYIAGLKTGQKKLENGGYK